MDSSSLPEGFKRLVANLHSRIEDAVTQEDVSNALELLQEAVHLLMQQPSKDNQHFLDQWQRWL